MSRTIITFMIVFLAACSSSPNQWHTNVVTGKVSAISASEGEIIIDGREFYLDPSGYEVGDILRVTFKDPTATEAWTPSEYQIEDVEKLPDDYFLEYKRAAWEYISEDQQSKVVTPWEEAPIDEGIASSSDVNQEIFDEADDRRKAYVVTFVLEGREDPYTVIVDQETKEVIGVERGNR
ncbi:hypothetical protein EQV77_13515 [Halobacillus fulvus]|nr:hypothetical protein EQV77_13515 [Halobacillus fulvus]